MSWGAGLAVGARIIRIDFPCLLKLVVFLPQRVLSSEGREKSSFKRPWLHFFEGLHGLGRGLSAGFWRWSRTGRGALAVGLAIDDELMSAMAEAVQSALAQQRFIEDGRPFVHAAIRRQNCGTAGVTFDQQIVEVRGRLAGKLPESEVVDDEEVGTDESPQLAIERIVRTRTRQSLEQLIGFSEVDTVVGAAGGMPESLRQKTLTDPNRAAKGHVFFTLDKVEAKQVGQPRLVDTDLGGPIEALQRALFLEACGGQPVGDMFLIAALDFVGQDQLEKLGVVDLFFAGVGQPVGKRGQQAGEFQAFQYGFQFSVDRHRNLLWCSQSDEPGAETSGLETPDDR